MIIERYSTTSKQTAIRVVQTEIEAVIRQRITRTGVRAYDGAYLGVAGAVGKPDLARLERQARQNLGLEISYPYQPAQNLRQHLAPTPLGLAPEQLVDEVEQLLAGLRRRCPRFAFSNKILLVEDEVSLVNDAGLNLAYADRHLSLELLVKDKASANILDALLLLETRRYDRQAVLEHAQLVHDAYFRPVKLPAGARRLPVVFSNTEGLLARKLLNDLEGWRMGSRSSLLADRLGKKVFSHKLTFAQTRHPDESFGPFFDAEGVVNPGYRFALIERGVLRAAYTDKKAAATFKLAQTGSAVADYDGVPRTGLASFRFGETGDSVASLLGGGPAVLVQIAMGGDFSPAGAFGTPVQLAFLFDGKKLLGRLPALQLSSNLFDMFGKDYRGVSNERLMRLGHERYLVTEMGLS